MIHSAAPDRLLGGFQSVFWWLAVPENCSSTGRQSVSTSACLEPELRAIARVQNIYCVHRCGRAHAEGGMGRPSMCSHAEELGEQPQYCITGIWYDVWMLCGCCVVYMYPKYIWISSSAINSGKLRQWREGRPAGTGSEVRSYSRRFGAQSQFPTLPVCEAARPTSAAFKVTPWERATNLGHAPRTLSALEQNVTRYIGPIPH